MLIGSLPTIFLDKVKIIENFICQSTELYAIIAMYFILTYTRHNYYCFNNQIVLAFIISKVDFSPNWFG